MSINAWGSDDPAEVAKGGTGAATLTDGGIVLGSGTSPVTVTSQPTNGQLLIGSSGSDPVLGSLTSTGATITITPGAGTINLEAAGGGGGGQPITDYVVDPDGGGDYSTIQDAIDQANSDGGGSVWIRPGSYSESLTLYDGVTLVGACATASAGGASVLLDTALTPPTSGVVEIRNIAFTSAAKMSVSAANTTSFRIVDCELNALLGRLITVQNGSGDIYLERCSITSSGSLAAFIQTTATFSGTIYLTDCVSNYYAGNTTANILYGDVYVVGCRNIGLNVQGGGTCYVVDSHVAYLNIGNATAYVSNVSAHYHGGGSGAIAQTGGNGYYQNVSAYASTTAPFKFLGTQSACEVWLQNCSAYNPSTAAMDVTDDTNGVVVHLSQCTLETGGGTYAYSGTSGTVYQSDVTYPNIDRISSSGPTITYESGVRGGGVGWEEVTGTSKSAKINMGYVANNASLVTVTLPVYAEVGDVFKITGKGAGGWRVAQNAAQIIHISGSTTTTGASGHIDSGAQYDGVVLVCITANTVWNAISSDGTISVT